MQLGNSQPWTHGGRNRSPPDQAHGHEIVGFDVSKDAVAALVKDKASGAKDLADLVKQLKAPARRCG